MSCFESSTFLRKESVMDIDVMEKALVKLGWQYSREKDALVVHQIGEIDSPSEHLMELQGNKVVYNSFLLGHNTDLAGQLLKAYNELNVAYSEQAVVAAFEGVGLWNIRRAVGSPRLTRQIEGIQQLGISSINQAIAQMLSNQDNWTEQDRIYLIRLLRVKDQYDQRQWDASVFSPVATNPPSESGSGTGLEGQTVSVESGIEPVVSGQGGAQMLRSITVFAYSRLPEDADDLTEIRFDIYSDGKIVSDSQYIPEDLHDQADAAMEKIDRLFGTARREGIEIKRKPIPARYQGKTYCSAGAKMPVMG